MESILLSKYAVATLTQALLAVLITIFLLVSTKKDCSTWRLIMFFTALSLSLISTFFLVGVHSPWRTFFGPAQGLVNLVGLVAMIQFAYTFPGGEVSSASRRALLFSSVLTLISFLVGANTPSDPQLAIHVLGAVTVILCVWAFVVFAGKSRTFTQEASATRVSMFRALRSPTGKTAEAHRAFARLMLLLIALSLVAFAEGVGLLSLRLLVLLITTFYLLFLIAFVFVYVNNSPTESTFMVKIVGVSLVTLLIVMGNMGTVILEQLEDRFDEERRQEMKLVLKSVVEQDDTILPKHVAHVFVYPMESEGGADLREEVYRQPGSEVSDFHRRYTAPVFTANVVRFLRENPRLNPDQAKDLALQSINRTDLLSWANDLGHGGMLQDLRCSVYYFTVTGFLFEVAYPQEYYGQHIDDYARSLIVFLLAATVLILVFFPRFFKGSLNAPLQALLGGMRRVNEGDMDVEVPIKTEDEFGFLTRSFNGMVSSIKDAESRLKEYAVELESRVEERTRDLNEKNVELERTLVELQETQNQLLLQEKMASVGQLVAGLAHEINNPIGVVTSSADVARRCVAQIDEAAATCESIEDLRNERRFVRSLHVLRENIDVTTQAGERIARIVRTLRSFARLDEAEYQVVRVEEGIESTIALMRHQVPDEVEIATRFTDTPPIHCSPGELNQIFMGLIRNAISAIEHEGCVTIATTVDNQEVTVSISDTGVGIPRDRLDRIFEIGFTSTRDRVKMGTGLTTAYRVVSEHGGVINIESEVGEGTTVEIRLPVKRERTG